MCLRDALTGLLIWLAVLSVAHWRPLDRRRGVHFAVVLRVLVLLSQPHPCRMSGIGVLLD